MERTKFERVEKVKTPSAILCSDFHLREDTPICFTGNWHQEQWKAVELIRGLQAQYKCPVLHAGDLLHHWKPSPALLTQALYFLPQDFYTIYGQHDLQQHAWELRHNTGLHTLEVAGALKVLKTCHWGQVPDEPSMICEDKKILVWHHLTYLVKPFPGATGGGMAEGVLRKYPQYDLIVTGDAHESFSIGYQGRLLVNPGNLTRQVADQIDYQPRVALWYAEDNSIKWVDIPCDKNAISREHIDFKERRDQRIDAFISKLDGNWEAGMSFEQNLEEFKSKNKVDKEVMEIIYKAIEE